MPAQRNIFTLTGAILFAIAWLNFMVFWIVAVSIGGDAWSGKVLNGHYFVSNHGKLTEVSSWVWHYSRYHTASIWITHPLGIFVGGGLMGIGRNRRAGGRNHRRPTAGERPLPYERLAERNRS